MSRSSIRSTYRSRRAEDRQHLFGIGIVRRCAWQLSDLENPPARHRQVPQTAKHERNHIRSRLVGLSFVARLSPNAGSRIFPIRPARRNYWRYLDIRRQGSARRTDLCHDGSRFRRASAFRNRPGFRATTQRAMSRNEKPRNLSVRGFRRRSIMRLARIKRGHQVF